LRVALQLAISPACPPPSVPHRLRQGTREEGEMENVHHPDSVDRGATDNPMAWKTRDFIVAAALAVPLGIIWSLGWGYVWTFGRSILPELGFVLDGFYVVAGVLVGYIVRRPGAALLGEMIASALEIPLTPFGAVVLWLGLLQGLGVEAVFAATRYRRWSLPVLLLAGALGALLPYFGYTYFTSNIAALDAGIQILRVVLKIVGGAIFAGLVGKLIADSLAATGVLNNFPIARSKVREV
jgi:energy-coupling factor transport system substrate-specific component